MDTALRLLPVLFVVALAACSSGEPNPAAAKPPTSQEASSQESPPAPATPGSSPTELEGCVPKCRTGLTRPGVLHGEYQTEWFFGGQMTVRFEKSWTSGEDSSGEFALSPTSAEQNGVFFWEDVYVVEDGDKVEGPKTAANLEKALRSSPDLEVSKAREGSIGNLPATVFDVSIASGAKNEDPGCPFGTCRLFLGFPQWDGLWGIAGSQVQRFHVTDVTYGGKRHLFVAVTYPDDPKDMRTFDKLAEEMIATVRVPADPV